MSSRYTINKLAKMAGVSVRTLHYYDEIGLLKPAVIGENNYRYYGKDEMLRLQQILFFRELELPLEQIKIILNSPNFDRKEALNEQLNMLTLERNRLNQVIQTVTKTINDLSGENMNDEELYGGLSREQLDEYAEEAKQRWGNTNAYKQSQQRYGRLTKEEQKKIVKDQEDNARKLAELINEPIESSAVQVLIKENHEFINKNFYDCSPQMYYNVALYTHQDGRYAQFWERFAPGLADFRFKAVEYYSKQLGVKTDRV